MDESQEPFGGALGAFASLLLEYRADHTAALLGYGPGLIEVLRIWNQMDGHGGQPTGCRERMFASHPFHDRINRRCDHVH